MAQNDHLGHDVIYEISLSSFLGCMHGSLAKCIVMLTFPKAMLCLWPVRLEPSLGQGDNTDVYTTSRRVHTRGKHVMRVICRGNQIITSYHLAKLAKTFYACCYELQVGEQFSGAMTE